MQVLEWVILKQSIQVHSPAARWVQEYWAEDLDEEVRLGEKYVVAKASKCHHRWVDVSDLDALEATYMKRSVFN